MANKARTQPGISRTTGNDINPFDKVLVFYEEYKKVINTTVSIIAVVVIGYLGYIKLYKAPREEKAATSLSFPQMLIGIDSLNLALNGDGQHPGLTKIAKKFEGTESANLSHYYAGICYMQMGDFKNAIKQLQDFDGKGTMIGYEAWGLLGEAYMETGNAKKAIEYFNKATKDENNIMLTPLYLYQAGLAYESNKQPDEAEKVFRRIRDEYPKSTQARNIDIELASLGDLSD
jgi:TolA-binding protein